LAIVTGRSGRGVAATSGNGKRCAQQEQLRRVEAERCRHLNEAMRAATSHYDPSARKNFRFGRTEACARVRANALVTSDNLDCVRVTLKLERAERIVRQGRADFLAARAE
jgi:hypothetical protein